MKDCTNCWFVAHPIDCEPCNTCHEIKERDNDPFTLWAPMPKPQSCLHDSPVEIHAAACINALGGDRRIPRAWCPDCGALRVSVDGEYRWELAK